MLNKWLAAIPFSLLLLVSIGAENAFANEPFLKVEIDNLDTELLQANGANPEDIIFDGGDFFPDICLSIFFVLLAEDFELAEDAFLRDVHFVGYEQFELPSTGVVYQILEDEAGLPGNIIASGTSVNFKKTLISDNLHDYWFDLEEEVLLDGDTRYWISFKTPDDGSNLGLCSTDFVFGKLAHTFNPQSGWFEEPNQGRYNFKLTGQSIDVVGGDFLPIDSTALILAGFQSSAIWMLPVLAGATGAGAYYIKTRMNKE